MPSTSADNLDDDRVGHRGEMAFEIVGVDIERKGRVESLGGQHPLTTVMTFRVSHNGQMDVGDSQSWH